MSLLALDVGGANLKAADGLGYAVSVPFPLWKSPHELAARLRRLVDAAPPAQWFAATMTGELCDCYETKAAGVAAILDALEEVAAGRPLAVYCVDGTFASPDNVRQYPLSAAASNWHALAAFAARFVPQQPAILCDVGSTTTDLIPIVNGKPAAAGRDDTSRLAAGELVYTGMERTPVCAAVRTLPWRGKPTPVAAEFFATVGDAYRVLGEVGEEPENRDTADGRARTRAASHARLARMIGADASQFDEADGIAVAEAIRTEQSAAIAIALRQVAERMTEQPKAIILSGQGELLGRRACLSTELNVKLVSLNEQLSVAVSRCAPAHALATLAREARTP